MKNAKAIPLVDHAEQLRTADRADKIRLLIKGGHWSFEETLRALSAVVFWSGGAKRKAAIAWLEELLVDLKATQKSADRIGFANDVWNETT